MGLFRRKEKRDEGSAASFSAGLLSALLGGAGTVTKAEALQIPTVASCVNIISERISALPVKLYRQEGSKVGEMTADKRLRLLNHDTGDTVNATELKKLWVRDYFLGKGSYTYIARDLFGEITGIYYVDEQRISVMPNNDPIRKSYAINVNGRTYFPFEFLKILRNTKGLGTGTSIIDEDPLILAVYYNTMKFENANIRKGGNKRGFLKAQNKLSQPAMEELRAAWRRLYSNSDDKEDNIVLLNDGVDFRESSSTSVELQLNENKQTNAAEICKLFCMPIDILNGKANETTISQFVQNCLMPLINTIEAALDHDLLTEAEKDSGYYFAFDTSELTRGDFASRMNGYATALQNNIYQLDEIREKEDLPPLGFNYIRLGLDTVLLDPKTGQIYTPNTDKTAVMSGENGLTKDEIRAIMMMAEEKRQAVFGEGHRIVGNIPGGQSQGGTGGGTGGSGIDENQAEQGISGKHNSKTAENSVDLNYIKSSEYKAKFKGITGNDAVDSQLYSQAVAQLTHRNGSYGEDMTVINCKTGKIEGRQSNSKIENTVEYNHSLNNAVKSNPPYTLITIHNHPTNNPPTGGDLTSNGSRKYKLGVVVTHNGRVFTYKAGDKPFLSKSFDSRVDKLRKKGYNEFDAITEALNQYSVEYGIEWSER